MKKKHIQAAFVELESADGRTHSVIVLLPKALADDAAMQLAEKSALEQVAGSGTWEVTEARLSDEVVSAS